MPIDVLAVAGSLRRASYNRAVLCAVAELAPPSLSINPFDLDLPLYNGDLEPSPPARIVELRARIRAAGAILFATPEYNYSISGVLKNAIDWGSQPFGANAWDGKPAAILGASISSIGTARAQLHLRQVLASLNVHVMTGPELLIGRAAEKFDRDGNLTDAAVRQKLESFLQAFASWIPRVHP